MGLSAAGRAAAQSFDHTAADYDRLGDLGENGSIENWLVRMLPGAGGRALDLGCGTGRHAVLLAGRIVLVDAYPSESALHPARRSLQRLVPLRPRLHALAVLRFGTNLAGRGPGTAWELYRLQTRREWLDHRVSDRFFSREELGQCAAALFPGCPA